MSFISNTIIEFAEQLTSSFELFLFQFRMSDLGKFKIARNALRPLIRSLKLYMEFYARIEDATQR